MNRPKGIDHTIYTDKKVTLEEKFKRIYSKENDEDDDGYYNDGNISIDTDDDCADFFND